MKKPCCPGCGSRQAIDMHSCAGEKRMRAIQKTATFNWSAVGSRKPKQHRKRRTSSCAKCGACKAGMSELCEVVLSDLAR